MSSTKIIPNMIEFLKI